VRREALPLERLIRVLGVLRGVVFYCRHIVSSVLVSLTLHMLELVVGLALVGGFPGRIELSIGR
jgi:hypothetical protein